MAVCPHCRLAMADVPELAGQLVACSSCGGQFQLPASRVMPSAGSPPPPMLQAMPPNLVPPAPKPVTQFGAFCRNCGAQLNPQAVACMSCGLPPRSGDKFCPSCRADTNPQAIVCVKCGVSLARGSSILQGRGSGAATTQALDPIIAAVLSLCIPGLSQILMGQVVKGVVLLLATFVLTVLCLIGIVGFPLAAIDAYLIAKKIQDGRAIQEWEFF